MGTTHSPQPPSSNPYTGIRVPERSRGALERIQPSPNHTSIARDKLIRLMQHEYSGELAAALAYRGHWKVLRDPTERAEVKQIEEDELHHRQRVGEMLNDLGAAPDQRLEFKMRRIGSAISFLCRATGWMPALGWYIPMYGAGRLERNNVLPYEISARLALLAGLPEIAEEMIEFAELEWDHELYFRQKCESHWLRKVLPVWKPLPARERIREKWGRFKERR